MASNTTAAQQDLGEGPRTSALPPSAVRTLGPGALDAESTPSFDVDASTPLAPGRRLGERYALVERIGRGGYGSVWRARHVQIGREFAIKVLLDARGASRDADGLIAEARRVSALEHANIVNMIDVGFVEPGRPFAVMELLVGRPLRAEFGGAPLPWSRVRPWALQTLAGLGFAHDAGIIHGDITPNNLFFDTKHQVTKLIDFGLAQGGDVATPESDEIRGTPAYMSPEQLQGEQGDLRSDLYSFACVFFEALTGAPPHRGTQNEIIVGHLEHDAPDDAFPDDVPQAVRAALLQCLRKSADDRPENAHELAATLRAAPMRTHPQASSPLPPRHPWRRPIAAAAAVVASALGMLLAAGPPAPASSLQPISIEVPLGTHAEHVAPPPPSLAAQLPVLEVATPRPVPPPKRARRSRRPSPSSRPKVLTTHPTGATRAEPDPPPRPATSQSIAHLDGPKNPFATTQPATTSP